jgi:hypothetical protein
MKPLIRLPVFVLCEDGKYYENLVYGDSPLRRGWFLCFDDKEPAEIVIRVAEYAGGNFGPKDILLKRGFGNVLSRIVNGRKDPHLRFFGCDEKGNPTKGAPAISWFCAWKKGIRFPTPNQYDQCAEEWPVLPGKPGILFGGAL